MARWVDETFNPHFRCALEADAVLYEGNTGFQDLIIFDNKTFGRVMMLDGVIQLTDKDEFIYHEMMAHVPLFAVDRPENRAHYWRRRRRRAARSAEASRESKVSCIARSTRRSSICRSSFSQAFRKGRSMIPASN